MSDVTINTGTTREIEVTVDIPADELRELFEDENYGHCWKCNDALEASSESILCCGCLEEEIKEHVKRECCDAGRNVFSSKEGDK